MDVQDAIWFKKIEYISLNQNAKASKNTKNGGIRSFKEFNLLEILFSFCMKNNLKIRMLLNERFSGIGKWSVAKKDNFNHQGITQDYF